MTMQKRTTGPDPVEAKKRFSGLKRQCTKTEKVLARTGAMTRSIAEMEKLGELFKFFKLTPKVFDPLINEPRLALLST